MRPLLSVRHGAASTMAGAIFMSNTVTREQCFQAGVFGLPIEYESFVYGVRKGMPLFLFDHNLRKLYGVFEAASDGGLNINRDAFQRAYPAQVRVNIIWKCRPLIEDEFAPAIAENYYLPRKFYFDLSYEQVVCLYKLFHDKRVERPIYDYPKNESLGTKDIPDERSLTPKPHSDDQSSLPDISSIVRRYSSHTSKHTVVPPSVEVQPNTTMPLATENFGAQIASTTTTHHQLASSQSFHHGYPHKVLSSGRIIQDHTEGAKFVANQSYPPSHDFAHNNSMSSGFVTQKNPTYRNPVTSASNLYAPQYPHLSFENPQGNDDYQEHCDICIRQRCLSAHDKMYAYEHQRLSEGKPLQSTELNQQGTPAYPEVPEFRGKTISAVAEQKNGSDDYIPLTECGVNYENASDSSNLENDMGVNVSDPRHRKHGIVAVSNTKVPQSSVFSRISPSQQPLSQEATGPTLSQLVSSLSQKAKRWSDENGPVVDGFCYMIREQATDRPYLHSEHLPIQLELEAEAEAGESTESQPPFLNFKRRSEARKVDTNLGKEIRGNVKRRKLVRPSFGENNGSSGNCIHEREHNHSKVGGNHFDIDLNVPAIVDSDPIEKHNSIEVCSAGLIKKQTEDADKTNDSDAMKTIKEVEKHIELCPSVLTKTQTEDVDKTSGSSVMHSDAPAKKVSFDINLAELNTMDELKLQTILDQTSSLLQAIGKIAVLKSNNFEEAKSNIRGEL